MRTPKAVIQVDKELKERIEAETPGLTWNERLLGLTQGHSLANLPLANPDLATQQDLKELKDKFSKLIHKLAQDNGLTL